MENGSKEERAAVRAALQALRTLNSALAECSRLRIKYKLIDVYTMGGPDSYVAEFTKTTHIMPLGPDE